MERQGDFFGSNGNGKNSKWEFLTARVERPEKEEIVRFCRDVLKMNYSVFTRAMWVRIIENHRTYGKSIRKDALTEAQNCVDFAADFSPQIRESARWGGRRY